MLAQFSEAAAALAVAASPMIVAVRTGPNRHVTGIRWRQDLVVVSDQALPAHESFTLVQASGVAEALPVHRDPGIGLALLRLRVAEPVDHPLEGPPAATGRLVVLIGAAFDASPTVRLAAIHRVGSARGNHGHPVIVLDVPADRLEAGSAAIDANGGLVGLATLDAAGEAIVVPYRAIARFAGGRTPAEPARNLTMAHEGAGPTPARRGWLGVALQPTTLPDVLRQKAGQASGRMVVSITPRGPADNAGLKLGDVLLALDGHSVSGAHALRGVLNADRIGHRLEVRLLRRGVIHLLPLIVAAQPED